MNAESVIALGVSVAVLCHLVYSLLRPEKF